MKPSQILARLCKDEGLDGPTYTAPGKCKIENHIFSAPANITDEAGKLLLVFIFVCVFNGSFIISFIYSFVRSFFRSFVRSFVHSTFLNVNVFGSI